MLKRCLGCMQMKGQSPLCEHCGFNENVDNLSHQLPLGTVLREQYLVGKALGQGGFGITYIGWDQNLDLAVAIKEYYPNGIVNRESTHSLSVSTSEYNSELYQHNRERFLREARALARLSNVPGIVGIYNFFPENNTAYIIMEYVEGIDLKRYIKAQGRPLTPEEAFAVLRPVMDSLSRVHEAGLVHRDISPDNIMIQRDGKAKLLDFGAVREVNDAQLEKNLSRSTESILKHGYAPIEQYQRRGNLGPWTDVYALCATVYYCLTQETPPDAPERMIEFAEVEWDKIPGLTEAQVKIFVQGMAIMPRDRYHSIAELRSALFPEIPEPQPEPEPKPLPEPVPEPEPEVALTVNAVVDATVISHITEQNQKKQEEIPPVPKAAQISLEERRLKRKQEQLAEKQRREQEQLRLQQEKLEQQKKARQEKLEQQRRAQEEKQRRDEELREKHRLEQEEKCRREAELQEQRRQQLLEKQLQEQALREQRKQAQLEKQRREQEAREKRRQEQEEKLRQEEEQKEQRRQAQIKLQEEKRQRQLQEQKDKQEQLELRKKQRLEEKQRKEAEKAGRSVHKLLISVLAVVAVMLTVLLLMPKSEDAEQMQETVPAMEYLAETDTANCRVPVNLHRYETTFDDKYGFTSLTEGELLIIESKDLRITVADEKDVTITVGGLDIQDSYMTNLDTSEKLWLEYGWQVYLFGDTECSVSTMSWVFEPGKNESCTLDQMQNDLWDGDGNNTNTPVDMEHTSDSITWKYTIPESCPFDFTTLKQVAVHVENLPENTTFCRVYNPATETPSVSANADCPFSHMAHDPQYETYGYETRRENGQLVIESEDLSITVTDNRKVTITVSGLDIQDSYLTNLPNSQPSQMEYWWSVFLVGEETHSVNTWAHAAEPGANVERSLDQMYHQLREGDMGTWLTDVTLVEWSNSSITWSYTVPADHPFDFTKLEQVIVHANNSPKATTLCRVYAPAAEVPAASGTPCMWCGDWREDSVMCSFQRGTRNSALYVEGENLSITVNGSHDVYVTVSGLDIRDSYSMNLSTTGKDMLEYGWHVTLHGEDTYKVGTSSWAFAPGQSEIRTIDQMQNSLWDVAEDGSAQCISNVYMDVSWDESSITWHYIIPSDHPFDFTKLKQISVHITNVPEGINSCWVYNPGAEQAASEQVFAYMPAENPTYAKDAWKKNVMMERPITDYGVYSTITSVIFLDTIAQAPADSWDISQKQNGRVLAWRSGTELYIGAEGGIDAGESCKYLFNGWKQLKTIHNWEFFHTDNTTSMFAMFSGCSSLTELDLSHFNTSRVTDMQVMFDNCSALKKLNVSSFDTSNVTDMLYMFNGCSGLKTLNVSNFNTSKVSRMGSMFLDCSSLTELDLSNFQTGKVTDMISMFQGCRSLKALNISNFNTSKVSGMGSMFQDCSSLTELDLSNFQTGKVTDMNSMFSGCSSLKALNVSKFDTSNVSRMTSMFRNCSALPKLDVSSFRTGRVYSFSSMFQGCSSLWTLDLSNFDTGNASSMEYLFDGCKSLASLNISSFHTSNVYDMSYMFRGCRWLVDLHAFSWDTSKVLNYTGFMDEGKNFNGRPWEELFEGASWEDNVMMANPFEKFTDFKVSDIVTVTFLDTTADAPDNCIDVSENQDGSVLAWAVDSNKPRTFYWKFTDVYIAANGGINAKIACEKLFEGQVSLESIHFNKAFHTEEVMNMSSMFASCMTLAELDLTSFETQKVMDMTSMFLYCHKLTALDISSLNTSKVTTMYKMFAYCESLDDPDLSSFNTTNVTEMSEMFYGCTGMKTLDISHFDTAKVARMRNMFHGCKNLEALKTGELNVSSVWDYTGFMDDGKTINGRPWEEFFEK